VILGLAAGRTHQEIADDEGVSLQAINDRIAALKETFDLPLSFMLGVISA